MEHIFEKNSLFDNRNIINDKPINNISDNIFLNMRNNSHEEYQYLNLLENILDKKDNIIISLNKRMNRLLETNNKSNFKRKSEIYVKIKKSLSKR